MHDSFLELVLYEGSAKDFILDYHKFHGASIKREIKHDSRMASLSGHIVRKWYNAKMHWNREKRSGTAMSEEREKERERRVRKGTNCLEIGVRSTS